VEAVFWPERSLSNLLGALTRENFLAINALVNVDELDLLELGSLLIQVL
jgi:hypothetical protein